MISLEKQLLKRFVLIATALILSLGGLQHWWAEHLYLKMQKQQLLHESNALAQHLSDSDNQLTALELNLPHHSSHLYLIQTAAGSRSSAPDRFADFPLQQWLSNEGFYQFTDTAKTSYLVLTSHFANGVKVIVVQDTTTSLAELEKSHIYMLLVVILALTLLLFLQSKVIRQAFSCFDGVRTQINALHRGERPTLAAAEVVEISPLIQAINQLLSSLGRRTERSNNAVGNLSHALKTPIAVIKQIAEKQSSGLNGKDRELLIEQADQLNYIISSELKRARIAGRGQQYEQFSMQTAVNNLTATLQLIYADKALNFVTDIEASARFPGNQADFNELLGNLLDNASKWCTRSIEINIRTLPEKLQIRVTDDGPGCSEEQLKTLTSRGVRLDEQAQGHGLGLNIVMTIVEQYDGQIDLGRAARGGLSVCVELPIQTLLPV